MPCIRSSRAVELILRLRLLRTASGLALAIVGSACVLSVDPVVSESGAVFDARLLGTWSAESDSDRVSVTRLNETTYAIEYTADGKRGRFEARLGKLGNRMVLDAWAVPGDSDVKEPYRDMLIPGHMLLALGIGADTVSTAVLDHSALRSALGARVVTLAQVSSKDQVILTGRTAELRAGLAGYVDRTGAWDKPQRWRRVTTRGSAASGTPTGASPIPCFEASAWRDADALFRGDRHWIGADAASTVDLGGGRILWLFGDTWIHPDGKGTRQGAAMVSNSVAIQTGTDPPRSSIAFYWGRASDGKPDAFIPFAGGQRLWFGNGARVGDRLVLFLHSTRSSNTGIGFEPTGWAAVMVENPDAEPSAWRWRLLDTPPNPLGILVGFASVVKQGDHVYAFGSPAHVTSHPIFAARWPAERVRGGDLKRPEWWAGERLGWVPDSSNAARWPVFQNGQTELSIHLDAATQQFLSIQTAGFGSADVMIRAAPAFVGPWSSPRMLYRPSEYYRPNAMIYAAKAHPELTGADLVLTYATNTFKFGEHLTDSLIYYPRFVRLTRCP